MITLIGDLHSNYKDYLQIVSEAQYSIQLGDFGFNYECLSNVDKTHHRFLKGNHDNYALKTKHELGDFGSIKMDGRNLFFIRGGHSIDQKHRRPYFEYFPNEELNYKEGMKCIGAFKKAKPKIVISHECPQSVSRRLFTHRGLLRSYGYDDNWDSSTSILLQSCFEEWQPEQWFFGHYHSFRQCLHGKTTFTCLPAIRNHDGRLTKQSLWKL